MRLALAALLVTAQAAWGPREALKRHEAEHDAAHAKEAAGDVEHLAEAVETRRGTVAAIKKTGVDMYGDKKAIDAVKDLQAATRRYLAAKYGQADSYTLDLQIKFPESMGGDRDVVTIETAPISLMPHAVHVFLDAAITRKGETWRCAFHRNAGHVLQAFLRAPGARGLAFQEYDAQFPHERLTLGFAGRPGGPEFYISTVDNVRNHGPGSQGSKTEADSCFAKVVSGADVVERMRKQPAPKGLGFVNNKADYIVVEDVQLRPPA